MPLIKVCLTIKTAMLVRCVKRPSLYVSTQLLTSKDDGKHAVQMSSVRWVTIMALEPSEQVHKKESFPYHMLLFEHFHYLE